MRPVEETFRNDVMLGGGGHIVTYGIKHKWVTKGRGGPNLRDVIYEGSLTKISKISFLICVYLTAN